MKQNFSPEPQRPHLPRSPPNGKTREQRRGDGT
jgi:hypothetical protein